MIPFLETHQWLQGGVHDYIIIGSDWNHRFVLDVRS